MSFQWSDYLKLAEALQSKAASSKIQEAYLRTAVSRAYYAAFITARNHLSQVEGEILPSSAKAYDLIWRHFLYHKRESFNKTGTYMRRLRDDRRRVDYDDKFPLPILKMKVQEDILMSRFILTQLSGFDD